MGVGLHVVQRRLADRPARSSRGDPPRHDDFLAKDAIGSGQWVLESHENGANIKFRKFQNFRQFAGTAATSPASRTSTASTSASSPTTTPALAAFNAGEIDTHGFTSRKQMDDTTSELGDKIVVGSDLSRDYFNLMLKYEPPFTDNRVRQAFNLLIDRDEAIQLLERRRRA